MRRNHSSPAVELEWPRVKALGVSLSLLKHEQRQTGIYEARLQRLFLGPVVSVDQTNPLLTSDRKGKALWKIVRTILPRIGRMAAAQRCVELATFLNVFDPDGNRSPILRQKLEDISIETEEYWEAQEEAENWEDSMRSTRS